jgi:hypothetical protein
LCKRLDRSRRNLVSLLRAALDLSFPIVTVVAIIEISSHILQSPPMAPLTLPSIDIRQKCGDLSVCIWIGLLHLDSFPCTFCTSGTSDCTFALRDLTEPFPSRYGTAAKSHVAKSSDCRSSQQCPTNTVITILYRSCNVTI